jgi:hypothetical protein
MKTPRISKPWAFVLPILTIQAFSACVEPNDGDLVIQQAQPLVPEGSGCIASTDETAYISTGTVDLAVAQNYKVFPLVRNNIRDVNETKRYAVTDARLNTKAVSLKKAKVKYHTQEAFSVQLPDREVPLSASVATQGLTTVAVELLTPALVRQFRNADEFIVRGSQGEIRPARTSIDLIVGITMEGETQDGNTVESNEFEFNLRVCNGCLVTYYPGCTNGTEEDTSGDVCVVGWESPISCAVCNAYARDPLARQLCEPAL